VFFICLHYFSTDKDNDILISLDMMTNGEIDAEINKLISDLEKIRAKAKKDRLKAIEKKLM